ncbi:hypothetical protein GGR56DRAFT_648180 [Xylariaceae sp. FL0804]|nr:hypothetical protein GGR56DRAFT_648180 [Xylariaceae sp. FL0804]
MVSHDEHDVKMADERTPLITTVIVAPPRQRYPHQTLRRCCTIALGSCLIALLVTFLVLVVFGPPLPDDLPGLSGPAEKRLTYRELQRILLDTPSSDKASEWSRYYTSGPHLAGKNLSQAEWTRDRWSEWGIKSDVVAYDTYINYPLDHRLAMLEAESGSKSESGDDRVWKVAFEATLEEEALEEDPTTQLEDSIPTLHGYSANGNVTGQFVYVNYGSFWDFEDLVKANVSLEGKIALARYGGIFRGLKVKRAQELGMIGCVIFTDPGDDGIVTEANGYDTYPNGPARHPSSVQRGSVQFLSFAPGDPTTPGYPSKPGVPRAPVDAAIPSIPSLPISYAEAVPILKALNGHGLQAKNMSEYWTRNLGLGYKGVEYNIGPSPENVVLNLYNEQEYTITPQWDVIGIVNGTIPDEVIIVGCHRDAWIAGGAGDPNSGSAALNEVVRSFGRAMEAGWVPLRTVVFGSWDGEEYGLVGSTEWVEEYLPWISATAVAYLNLDTAALGGVFEAAAAPLLHGLLRDVTALVPSPNQTVPGQTVGDLWDGRIRTMGSGSDFTAFQDFAGVPCVHVGFTDDGRGPVYQYHSNYDSYHWMSEFGDPGFRYHRAMAQLFGLAVAKLSDSPLVPLNATDYAAALWGYVDQVEAKLPDAVVAHQAGAGAELELDDDSVKFPLGLLRRSISRMHHAAVALDAEAATLAASAASSSASTSAESSHDDADMDVAAWQRRVRGVNDRYKRIERAFLHAPGLDGRPWFKHVVFAPGLWTGYAGAVFPGLDESIDAGDAAGAARWIAIIEGCVVAATAVMRE